MKGNELVFHLLFPMIDEAWPGARADWLQTDVEAMKQTSRALLFLV